MPEIQIRPVLPADLPHLIKLDHTVESDHVWQMSVQDQEGQIGIQFRENRLPRPVRLSYPRDPRELADLWQERPGTLVAVLAEDDRDDLIGYLTLLEGEAGTARVTGMAVHPELRRSGIGTALLIAAQDLGRHHSFDQIILEVHAKNYPAIQLATKMGFDFYGYRDRYYAAAEIALFFGKKLRSYP